MQAIQTQPRTAARLPRTKSGASTHALLALVLALLTGLTLGQLTLVGGSSLEKPSGRSTEATRTGMEFYDAIGAYLTTGQSAELQALVRPDVLDHIDGQPAASGFGALLRQFETLRQFGSEERLTVTPMSSNGDLVRFAVSMPPGGNATVLGLPVSQTEVSTYSETLRIVDGRVAERWSNFQAPVATEVLASTAWNPPPAARMLPAIQRLTMLSDSWMTLQLGTAHVIVVESGSLTITGTPRRTYSNHSEIPVVSTETEKVEPIVALPGSVVVAAGSSPYRIVNDGPAVVSALLIRIAGYSLATGLPASGALGTSQNDAEVQVDSLSAAIPLPNRKGDWTIEIGRATFAPGMIVPPHKVAGSELIFVEQGTLDTDLGPCGSRCIQTIEGAGSLATEQNALHAGQGISASDGATAAYRVAGSAPVTLLIVTVTPARG